MSSTQSFDTTDSGIELWRVQLSTGEVRAMSLDALDDAFQAGVIGESTPVLPPGSNAWTKLADAAGLDAPPVEPTVPSLAPLAVSIVDPPVDSTPYAQTASLQDERLMQLAVDDEAAFKPKRGRMFAGIGVAVLVVAGLGFAATRAVDVAAVASNSISAHGGKASAAAPPPAEDPELAARAKMLTEEQKAKLAEADKAREAAALAREEKRRKDRPTPPAKRGPHEKSTTPFVNGGSKFDPLNGAL